MKIKQITVILYTIGKEKEANKLTSFLPEYRNTRKKLMNDQSP